MVLWSESKEEYWVKESKVETVGRFSLPVKTKIVLPVVHDEIAEEVSRA